MFQQMPQFITVTDYGSGMPIRLNVHLIFSVFRKPGTDCTVVKSAALFEQVRETPEQIAAAIGALELPHA